MIKGNPISRMFTVVSQYHNKKTNTHIKKFNYFFLSYQDAEEWIDWVISEKQKNWKLKVTTDETGARVAESKYLGCKWRYHVREIFDYNIRIA